MSRSSTLLALVSVAALSIALAVWGPWRAAGVAAPPAVPAFVAPIETPREEVEPATELERPAAAPGARVDVHTPASSNAPRTEEREADVARRRAKMLALAELEEWADAYAAENAARLRQRRDAVEKALAEQTRAVFEQRWAAGLHEVVESGPAYHGLDVDPCEVCQIRVAPGGPVEKCALPESFEAAYRLRALSAWLAERAQELESGARQR